MYEYKVVAFKWTNARTLGNVYDKNGNVATSLIADHASEGLTAFGREGWHVVSCWRNEAGACWFVLERER